MSREGHEKLLSHPMLRFFFASWLRQGGSGLIYTVTSQVFPWMQLLCFGKADLHRLHDLDLPISMRRKGAAKLIAESCC